MLSEAAVLDALGTMIDPALGLDIVSFGLLCGIEITPVEVRVTNTLTSPGCPLGDQIERRIVKEVSATMLAGERC